LVTIPTALTAAGAFTCWTPVGIQRPGLLFEAVKISAVSDQRLDCPLDHGQRPEHRPDLAGGGTLSTSGSTATVRNAAYNGSLAASASPASGFIGSGSPAATPMTCTSPQRTRVVGRDATPRPTTHPVGAECTTDLAPVAR
jgi:hypothetical protein